MSATPATSIDLQRLSQTVAVVVTYHPNQQELFALIEALAPQVHRIIIVDNGSDTSTISPMTAMPHVQLIALDHNKGIAAAQNIGIQAARQHRAQFVLLMDQDSIPAPDMVTQLHRALAELPHAAAVGPVYVSEHQSQNASFPQVRGCRRVNNPCNQNHPIAKTDALIASGCLIPISVLDQIEGMREELFIDYVDTEWGLRAQHAGLKSYGVFQARMHHHLGNQGIEFAGRTMTVHSPLRRYYQYRNAVLLYKMSHIRCGWKLNDAFRQATRFVVYALTNRPRWTYIKMMSTGIWHGILGKTGAYHTPSSHR